MDEFHDLYDSHPERQQVWEEACLAISQMDKQHVFMSATHPPQLDKIFRKKACILPMQHMQLIRASTNRPELVFFVLNLPKGPRGPYASGPSAMERRETLWRSMINLVGHLAGHLTADE